MAVMLRLYGDNGKEMGTTIMGYIAVVLGIKEKNMETAIMGYIWVMLRLYCG